MHNVENSRLLKEIVPGIGKDGSMLDEQVTSDGVRKINEIIIEILQTILTKRLDI